MQNLQQQAYMAVLKWHIDIGVDALLFDEPCDHLARRSFVSEAVVPRPQKNQDILRDDIILPEVSGAAALRQEAMDIAGKATDLPELAAAIQHFSGLEIKKTATHFVFSDGDSAAKIMVIGAAPGADEDRSGVPFSGANGQLLDKILACIGCARVCKTAEQVPVYCSNILNWRPPGNRTPTPQEIELSLPFIERHIMLVKPDILILCGGSTAQALLKTKDTISKLRGKIHMYHTNIRAVVTYHPLDLLTTPTQKSKLWQDMLLLQRMRAEEHDAK